LPEVLILPPHYPDEHKERVHRAKEIYAMYHQINPTETFRDRHLALLAEAHDRRRARRLRAPKTRAWCPPQNGRKVRQMNQAIDNRTSGTAWSTKALGACLMVVATLLAACLTMAAQPAHASTTFTVNLTDDQPDASAADGRCDYDLEFTSGDQCTLRAAIEQANATPGADAIHFNIPGSTVRTIEVNRLGFGALPPIKEQVEIDGYTQPDSSPNTLTVGNNATLKVELNGASVDGGSNGLEIATSDSSVIKGLVINRFTQGIEITGDAVANRIEGNFIGTDPTGTLARGNLHGIVIDAGTSATVVGGSTPAARNLISGNNDTGVLDDGSHADRVQGNYIGTDKSGTKDLGNVSGGLTFSNVSDTLVGGTTAASRNVVSGNDSNGISIQASTNNKVLGNRIGTTASGTVALGNRFAGVTLVGSNNLLGDGTAGGANTVAFNGQDGIEIFGITSTGNAISRNSVFSNAGLGIDLRGGFEDATGKTANEPGDIDVGPNGLQNFPVLTSAKSSSTTTTISATLSSTPTKTFKVQFFSNPSGNEGKKFIGQKSVTTNGSGNVSFTFSPASKVAVGQTITAAATDTTNNTSEFSASRTVASS
jgi:CSLREA domain-containing protein